MELKKLEVNAQLELLNVAINTEHDKIQQRLINGIKNLILDVNEAYLVRAWIQKSHWEDLNINFEFGFWNTTENRVDFGSDCWCSWSSENHKLKLNYGTCGAYSSEDIYQVKRVKTISFIWDHIDEIESFLESIFEDSEKYRDLQKEEFKLELELVHIKEAERDAARSEIEKNLKIGQVLFYDKDIRCSNKLFNDLVDDWRISSITDKNIKLRSDALECSKLIKKEKIVNMIYMNTLHVKES